MLWIVVGSATGAFAFAFVPPIVVANAVVMSFVLTNHGLCSATDVNDPLIGSLSVTTPRWIAAMDRVAHAGSRVPRRASPVAGGERPPRALDPRRDPRAVARALSVNSARLGTALLRVFTTGRAYRDATTLVDPRSGGAWSTLAPPERLHEEIG